MLDSSLEESDNASLMSKVTRLRGNKGVGSAVWVLGAVAGLGS